MLANFATWDAATPGERRGVAEHVAATLDGFRLSHVQKFGFEGHRHEIAILTQAATGLEFSLIPGGTFLMGSPESEEGRHGSEGPQHEVTITHAMLVARTETTQAAWTKVMGANPSSSPGRDHPVEGVSWADAASFCERSDLRLPTEAEWEYACRAGTTTRFWFGNMESDLPRAAWYRENQSTMTGLQQALRGIAGMRPLIDPHEAVGTKAANPWGLCDMTGNVNEWCTDFWSEHYLIGSASDPTGPPEGPLRVCRGGSRSCSARLLRSATRFYFDPTSKAYDIGFRPVRTVPR